MRGDDKTWQSEWLRDCKATMQMTQPIAALACYSLNGSGEERSQDPNLEFVSKLFDDHCGGQFKTKRSQQKITVSNSPLRVSKSAQLFAHGSHLRVAAVDGCCLDLACATLLRVPLFAFSRFGLGLRLTTPPALGSPTAIPRQPAWEKRGGVP